MAPINDGKNKLGENGSGTENFNFHLSFFKTRQPKFEIFHCKPNSLLTIYKNIIL
jgi:hypothetical protein